MNLYFIANHKSRPIRVGRFPIYNHKRMSTMTPKVSKGDRDKIQRFLRSQLAAGFSVWEACEYARSEFGTTAKLPSNDESEAPPRLPSKNVTLLQWAEEMQADLEKNPPSIR